MSSSGSSGSSGNSGSAGIFNKHSLRKMFKPLCAFVLISGTVAAVIGIDAHGKAKRGTAAPEAIQGKSTDIMRQREHGKLVVYTLRVGLGSFD
jgi:hypothetical protein